MNADDLEKLIESYCFIGTHAVERTQRQLAFARMRELIAQRSPETIERMERARGLRAL